MLMIVNAANIPTKLNLCPMPDLTIKQLQGVGGPEEVIEGITIPRIVLFRYAFQYKSTNRPKISTINLRGNNSCNTLVDSYGSETGSYTNAINKALKKTRLLLRGFPQHGLRHRPEWDYPAGHPKQGGFIACGAVCPSLFVCLEPADHTNLSCTRYKDFLSFYKSDQSVITSVKEVHVADTVSEEAFERFHSKRNMVNGRTTYFQSLANSAHLIVPTCCLPECVTSPFESKALQIRQN